MNLQCLFAAYIIVRCITLAMKSHGGRSRRLTRKKVLAIFGGRHVSTSGQRLYRSHNPDDIGYRGE